MKKITVILTLLVLFLSCTRTIMIRSAPSDLVLLGVQAKNDIHVISQVDYRIDDPYIINQKYILQIKKALINQYENFFFSKYPKQGTGDADYNIKIILNDLDYVVENVASGLQTANMILGGNNLGTDMHYSCTLRSTIEIKKQQSIDTVNIVAVADENITKYNADQGKKATQETLEDCISKSIILTSRKLDAIIK